MLLPNEDGLVNGRTSWLFLIGRRANDVGIVQARAELEVIAAQIDADEPGRRTAFVLAISTGVCLLASRRAVRIEPMVVLRYD